MHIFDKWKFMMSVQFFMSDENMVGERVGIGGKRKKRGKGKGRKRKKKSPFKLCFFR